MERKNQAPIGGFINPGECYRRERELSPNVLILFIYQVQKIIPLSCIRVHPRSELTRELSSVAGILYRRAFDGHNK